LRFTQVKGGSKVRYQSVRYQCARSSFEVQLHGSLQILSAQVRYGAAGFNQSVAKWAPGTA
jgi:hypothetical protein